MSTDEKKRQRELCRKVRDGIENKDKGDRAIFEKVITLDSFQKSDTVLCYYSVKSEVDTRRIIEYCLEIKKPVALPVCREGGGMDFLLVSSFDDITSLSRFGIPEPCGECEKAKLTKDTFCIVPGLAFDKEGYRIGYGGGYYDRFLKDFPGSTAGLCFCECIIKKAERQMHDIKVDTVITD